MEYLIIIFAGIIGWGVMLARDTIDYVDYRNRKWREDNERN
jgi:hypothetical protein